MFKLDTSSIIQAGILILLLFLSAFFSSAETSLTTINPIKVRTLIENGNKRAMTLQKVIEQHGKMLSAILIGNNIVNISASSLATTMAIEIWGNFAVGIATGILTILVLLFGEIVPKNIAMIKSEPLALFFAPIIYGLMWILTPVIFIIDTIAGFFLKLVHINPGQKNLMTENELRTYVDVSHEDGVIESEEKDMIINVFDFSDSVAKDIMIPRIDMVTIEENAGYNELMALFR